MLRRRATARLSIPTGIPAHGGCRAATDWLNFGSVSVTNLAADTRQLDVDYRSDNSGYTAKIKNVRFCGVPLE